MITLDIYFDPICPWCLIGKTHLDAALKSHGHSPFTPRWHPFQLNPDMPLEGMDRRAYLLAKFGGEEKAYAAYKPVSEHAETAGLALNLDQIKRTPNTVNAHRVIQWSLIEGAEDALIDLLFKAYFIKGQDIGDPTVLAQKAKEVGLDPEMVLRLLETDNDIDTIKTSDSEVRRIGITSVPTFILAGRHVIQGAQGQELWKNVLLDIDQELARQDNT